MATTEQDIKNFTEFAREQLSNGGAELSIDDLFDMWRAANPLADELGESVVTVRAALCDMEAGHAGIPVDEHLARLRSRFSIPESE